MRLFIPLLCAVLVAASPALANGPAPGAEHSGWGYLVDKLIADGLPGDRVRRVFDDPRLEPFTGLDFSLGGREPSALYRAFLRPSSIASARRCRAENADVLRAAEKKYGVQASVVAAILYVETGCGRNTGSSAVFYRLARLAMANEPENLQANLVRLAGGIDAEPWIAARVRERARYLEDTFYPEVRAAFALADRLGTDPLDLRGSSSGAVGTPQFLPTSYLTYGADADGDGRVDLYDPADAAASCANYLAAQGWRPGLTRARQRAVIWRYNRSDAYVDTVLTLAGRLDGSAAAASACTTRTMRKAVTSRKARAPVRLRQGLKPSRTSRRAAR